MKHLPLLRLLPVLLLLSALGCTRMVMPIASSMVPGFTSAFFEECDLKLAEISLPAELKLLEGLLKNDPRNPEVLTALCMGFTGYALLFVEDEEAERASALYLRAKTYGLLAMGIETDDPNRIQNRIKKVSPKEIRVLFWTTMAWNAWVNLNLDNPLAIGESAVAEKCLKRVLDMDPGFYYGTPLVLMGSILSARPPILGGNPLKAKEYFERALALTDGKFLLAQYYFARYYAVRIQDKDLFDKLVKDVATAKPEALKDACLINQAVKQKMVLLAETEDELFL